LPGFALVAYVAVLAWRVVHYDQFYDFAAYFFGARAARLGLNFYDQDTLVRLGASAGYVQVLPGFLYPPPAIFLFLPLTPLSFDPARWIWIGVDLLSLALALRVIVVELGLQRPAWLLPVLPLLVAAPFYYALLLVQVSPVLLLLLALSWRAYRQGRPDWCGLWLGLATVLRLTPGFLLILFLARRDFRVVLPALLTIAVALVGTAAVFPSAFGTFAQTVLLGSALDLNGWWDNLSVQGMLVRLFLPNGYTAPIAVLPDPRPLLNGLRLAGALAVAALGWADRRRGKKSFDLAFALAIGVLLLVEPLTWAHTLTLLFLSIMVYAQRVRGRGEWLMLGLGALLLSAPTRLTTAQPQAGLVLLDDRLNLPAWLRSPTPELAPAWWALVLAGGFYGQLLLLGLGFRLWRDQRRPRSVAAVAERQAAPGAAEGWESGREGVPRRP
jgi:alpha-1,2-mannosyltransferase